MAGLKAQQWADSRDVKMAEPKVAPRAASKVLAKAVPMAAHLVEQWVAQLAVVMDDQRAEHSDVSSAEKKVLLKAAMLA